MRLGGRQLALDVGILLGMVVLEAQVFQFGLDFVQSEPVGQRCIDVEGLAGNLILLVGRLRTECTHVVQTVTNLDEYHTDVVTHGEQQLFEVFCLGRSAVTEDTARNLGQAVHDLRYLRAEDVLNVLYRVVGVFHHVVEQGRADARGTQAHFLAGDAGHGNGVHDIRYARQAADAFVRLASKIEGFGDDVHLFAVARSQINVEQLLEGRSDHQVVGSFSFLVLDGLFVHVHAECMIYKVWCLG